MFHVILVITGIFPPNVWKSIIEWKADKEKNNGSEECFLSKVGLNQSCASLEADSSLYNEST